MFEIEKLTCYADDGFGVVSSVDKSVLVTKIESKLGNIEKWLSMSGMKVNEAKTCLCLFYHKDTTPIEITLNNVKIKSETKINVLGVIFDQKLQWSDHVAYCISKSNKALLAMKLIKRYFNTNELLQLITSNFYSVLYYNCEIWQIPSLKTNLKRKLLTASAKAIKMCLNYDTSNISYENMHKIVHRSTPENFLLYKHALALYKLYWSDDPTFEFCALNNNSIFTSRQVVFITSKDNKRRVGINALANRLYPLNNRIPLMQLNKGMNSYKIFCKNEFLKTQ